MEVYLALGALLLMNIVVSLVTLADVRKMHNQHRREMEIKMQRSAALFANILKRLEALEDDTPSEGKSGKVG